MNLTVNPVSRLSLQKQLPDKSPSTYITLCNTNQNQHITYKLKATQTLRYLVKPFQGCIPPNTTIKINIRLDDQQIQPLLNSYSELGEPALSSNEDKFLVQSYALGIHDPPLTIDEVTEFWKSIGQTLNLLHVVSNKLQVDHSWLKKKNGFEVASFIDEGAILSKKKYRKIRGHLSKVVEEVSERVSERTSGKMLKSTHILYLN